jgi:hypothetical protein
MHLCVFARAQGSNAGGDASGDCGTNQVEELQARITELVHSEKSLNYPRSKQTLLLRRRVQRILE